jgi:hypothetical protein
MFGVFKIGNATSAHGVGIVEIFMFWAHAFCVDGANQLRYLSAMPVSIGTTQINVGHYSTMV